MFELDYQMVGRVGKCRPGCAGQWWRQLNEGPCNWVARSYDWPIHPSTQSARSKWGYKLWFRVCQKNKNFSRGFMTRLLVVDYRAIGYHLQMFFRQNQLQLFKHLPIFPAKTNYDLSLSEFFRHHWTNNFITDIENRNWKPSTNSFYNFKYWRVVNRFTCKYAICSIFFASIFTLSILFW